MIRGRVTARRAGSACSATPGSSFERSFEQGLRVLSGALRAPRPRLGMKTGSAASVVYSLINRLACLTWPGHHSLGPGLADCFLALGARENFMSAHEVLTRRGTCPICRMSLSGTHKLVVFGVRNQAILAALQSAETERMVVRVAPPQVVVLDGQLLNFFGQGVEQIPETASGDRVHFRGGHSRRSPCADSLSTSPVELAEPPGNPPVFLRRQAIDCRLDLLNPIHNASLPPPAGAITRW
jgi:hypothetical protein